MRPLIVGQAPGRASDPAEPLSGRCGARLADLCGLDPDAFLRAFERVNLVDRWPGKAGKGDAFPVELARARAVDLLVSGRLFNRRVVFLGGPVALTFGIRRYELLRWSHNEAMSLAVAPHPSGIVRWWNDAENVAAARAFWRDLAADR